MNASGPSADLTCPNCESPVRAGAWFCSTCGFDLLAHAPKQADPPNAENAAQPQDPPTADSADQPDTENAARPEEPTATFTARLRARAEQTLRQVGYRKVIVVVGVVGVIVALVLGSGHVVRSQAAEGPEPLVQALFTALANRDEVKARELDVCANSPVCVPGSLDRGYEPPDDLQIKRVAYGEPNPNDPTRRPDKNHAIVQASYRVGAETHDDTFFLRRSSQVSEAGVESRTWSFENPVGRHVSLRSQYATLVRVAGSQTQLKTAEPGGRAVFRTLWLLPGSYEVAGVSNVLFGTSAVLMTVGGRDTCVPEPGSSTIVAGMTSPLEGNTSVHILNDCKGLETTINLTLKAGVNDEINRQVKQYVDTCASQPTFKPVPPKTHKKAINLDDLLDLFVPRVCPFFEDTYEHRSGQKRNITWTITKYPEVTLDSLREGPVTTHTTTPGAVTLTFDWSADIFAEHHPEAKWTRITEDFAIRLDGQVTVSDTDPGAIVWTATQ